MSAKAKNSQNAPDTDSETETNDYFLEKSLKTRLGIRKVFSETDTTKRKTGD